MQSGEADPGGMTRSVFHHMGRALGRFSMLSSGDRVAVGVSGGKDSLCLVHALAAFRRRSPVRFDLIAVTINQGKFTGSLEHLADVFARIDIPWVRRDEARTLDLVRDGREHGCDVCSRNRRGALYETAAELGCNVIGLGHTADDCAESLFRNVLFNGRIGSLPPVARSRKGPIRIIRPLVYVTEDQTAAYVASAGLDPVGCVCQEKDGPRSEIRRFLAELEGMYPDVRESLMSALGNVAPYTLFDVGLRKEGADQPEFSGSGGPSDGFSQIESPDLLH